MQQETHQNRTLSVGYSLGMVKMEAFDNRRFMHQFVTLTKVRRYVRMYICMYVCVYVCMYVCMYVCNINQQKEKYTNTKVSRTALKGTERHARITHGQK